jgi:hypothetical protein
MTYIQVDLENPETAEQLAVHLIRDLLAVGNELEVLHLESANLNWNIDVLQSQLSQIEDSMWAALRDEAQINGAPKDPLTKKSNKEYNKDIVNKRLTKHSTWVSIRDRSNALLEKKIMSAGEISGLQAKLNSLIAAAKLLGELL